MIRLISLSLLLSACGSSGGGVDGGGGDCVGTYGMEWPTPEMAEFCTLEWGTTSPQVELTECGEVNENCSDDGPTPDFSCLGTPIVPGDGPETVTLTGYADVFSSGPSANKSRLQIYASGSGTPLTDHDIVLDETSLVSARACAAERTDVIDNLGGNDCVLPTNDCGGGCDKTLQATQFCYVGSCYELSRWEVRYEVDDVPTNEFLQLRTVGLDNEGNEQPTGNTWAPMVQENVYLRADEEACTDISDTDCLDGTNYQFNINLLSSQDYMSIPTSAGLSAGIASGHGAIAGEVHDCQGRRVQHAQVGFSVGSNPRALVYFNGNPVRTLPRLQQSTQGTNALGLYAGLDLEPGVTQIVAIGTDGNELMELGRFETVVRPDTVTLIRLGGGVPPQQ